MRRHHRIPAAFLQHPPPSWGRGRRRRNPLIENPIITNARRRRHRHNPILRNPLGGGIGMMPLLLIGGGLFFFMSGSGRAMLASLTGGTQLPPGVPAGSVRLADGTYRTPTGQILGTPIGTPGYITPLLQAIPSVTGWLANLFSGSSATGTIVSGVPPVGVVTGDVLGTGAGTVTAPDILTGWGIGDPLPPIPTLPDLTLSDWWATAPATQLDLSLMPIADQPAMLDPLVDPWSGFMGLGRRVHHDPLPGWSRTLRRPASYA